MRAEGFPCSLDVPGGLGISKLHFLIKKGKKKFLHFLVIKTPDQDPDRASREMLDRDPDSINPYPQPQHGFVARSPLDKFVFLFRMVRYRTKQYRNGFKTLTYLCTRFQYHILPIFGDKVQCLLPVGNRIADSDPGSGDFLTPGSGIWNR